jgi:dihydrofolate reductase
VCIVYRPTYTLDKSDGETFECHNASITQLMNTLTQKGPRVSIVVAMSRTKRAIGKGGKLLWHIPEDMKRFKDLTMGHPVIMGRKTFESIINYLGTPLPGRTNIVVSRVAAFTYPGVIVAPSLEDALENARVLDSVEIHIGGGSEIYAQALPLVDRLYLTIVDDEPEADTYFPEYTKEFSRILSHEARKTKEGLGYEWLTYER